MGDNKRGTIERVTVDIRYPDGSGKRRVIEGDELRRTSVLVLKPEALDTVLSRFPGRKQALAEFERGDDSDPDSRPAMMSIYDDGAYLLECRPSDHNPPSNR